MQRTRFSLIGVGVASFLVLIFGMGVGHFLLDSSILRNMGEQMTLNQCQSSCMHQNHTAAPNQKLHILDDKEIDPQPPKFSYLAYIGVGWSAIILIVAAYLIRYLRWRPPDLVKLHCTYRF